jgi:hypothetical protein
MVRTQALTQTDTHLHSLMVTMSQKSSILQPAKTVSKALTPDTPMSIESPGASP